MIKDSKEIFTGKLGMKFNQINNLFNVEDVDDDLICCLVAWLQSVLRQSHKIFIS